MRKSCSVGVGLTAFFFLLGLAGCSSGPATTSTTGPVPATIALTPASSVSVELGQIQSFTTTSENSAKQTLTETISFLSSNTSVVTIAANGLACAGTWDNLTSPQVCTPGGVGAAEITATAQGVSSPPTTVYVHQHIDQVTALPFTPPNIAPSTAPCETVGQNLYYQAKAYSRGADITSSVGPFTWQALNTSVAKLSTTAAPLGNLINGVSQNQVQVTAAIPGLTPIFAAVGTATSLPANFTTCPVQSISVAVNGNNENPVISSKSGGTTAVATVTDILGNQITGVPLTWSSSQSGSVTAASGSMTSAISGTSPGAATVVASCIPPTCDVGIFPAQPIYPEDVVTMVVAPTGGAESGTIYVGSTACGTIANCISTVVPLALPNNTAGTAVILPATPNSLVFARQGGKGYVGTNSGFFGAVGLAILTISGSSATVAELKSAPGKVLAVSPDGTTLIVSDTADAPNQVFVVNTATATLTATLPITGATAADFSPDGLKAYIVAGSKLYIYSKLDALQTIPLTAPAVDVSFLTEGAFAYLAGGSADGVTVFSTCANANVGTVPVSPAPVYIRPVAGGSFRFVALSPPDITVLNLTTQPQGCAPTVSNLPPVSFNLGQGNFTPTQLIVSEDGSTAYVVSSNLNSILAFSILGEVTTSIPLAGNAKPIQASLTPDGNLMYVAATDGMVHVLNTQAGGDIQQVSFPLGFCQDAAGQPYPNLTCNPDLIAVVP